MIEEFTEAMQDLCPHGSRVMYCSFRGNPEADIKGKWRARVLNRVDCLDELANIYVCVSAMKKNARGEYRRRKDNFAGGLLLMIDDLGHGPAAKFPMSTIEHVAPTALIETSPDNYQAIYMFDEPEENMARFEALIRAFIDKEFLGQDTGMAGVNRVFRPPYGVNGKPKHGGWKVRCAEWHPNRRYDVASLAEAFRLDLRTAGPRVPRGATANKADNIRAFVSVRAHLREAGMLKKDEADLAGWTDVRCPWMDEHTGGVDNGAAIRLPDADNAWYGAFKCFHGSCDGRGWRELTEWLAEEHEELLHYINLSAGDAGDYIQEGVGH